jgi:hypothetical protein
VWNYNKNVMFMKLIWWLDPCRNEIKSHLNISRFPKRFYVLFPASQIGTVFGCYHIIFKQDTVKYSMSVSQKQVINNFKIIY